MSQKKQIFKLNILKNLLTDENSCVSLVQSTRLLPLPPFFLNDMKSGILYLLNTMLKKYDRSLGGIVIGYQNIKVLMDENTGIIPMGTSETEVNISVDFYIFQPKIGSYLEGVVNKKSNNHIGCLVHRYFNATILKPEDVFYEDWICKDFNVDDKIIFKVKDLDFTTLLPYIEGIYDGRISLNKIECKKSGNCDTDSVIVHDANKISYNEDSRELLKDPRNVGEYSEDKFLDRKKSKKTLEAELNSVNVHHQEGSQASIDLTIKKPKNKKEEMKFSTSAEDYNQGNEEKSTYEKNVITDGINIELQVHETNAKKKKKKKKKKKEDNEEERQTQVENDKNETLLQVPHNIYESLLELECENSNVMSSKSKDEKKINVINQCEESFPNVRKSCEYPFSRETEDSILYSTQLEPLLESKKMRISFCSPIPGSTSCDKTGFGSTTRTLESSIHLNNVDNLGAVEQGTKKKHKKRKREKLEESEDSPSLKKIKLSNPLREEHQGKEMYGDGRKSVLQRMMEELYQQQLNRVREELNISSSDRESLKGEKRKNEVKKKKKDIGRNESLEAYKNMKSQINGQEKGSELQSSFEEGRKQELLHRVKEELRVSDTESFKESKKTKVKMKEQEKETPKKKTRVKSCKVKENRNAQINSKSVIEKKSEVKSVTDELCRQEINRVKEELNRSDTDIKKKRKKKSVANNRETSIERTHDLLYNKLLNEAKIAIDSEKNDATEFLKQKKDIELSDVSTGSSRKKDSKKRSKHGKQKLKDCHQQPHSKYKNGSMYDVAATPEKINPDKSLFSDSEQSHTSPAKRRKDINGIEVGPGRSKVQNMLDEFYKEEMKRLKSESDRESVEGSKKRSDMEDKSQIPTGKEESLYEKLLKEAKSRIDVREASLPVKKEKKERERKKKQKMVQDCFKS